MISPERRIIASWWVDRGPGGAESEGSPEENSAEEMDMAAIISSLAPPLQFTLISPKFPRGAQLPHKLLLSTHN